MEASQQLFQRFSLSQTLKSRVAMSYNVPPIWRDKVPLQFQPSRATTPTTARRPTASSKETKVAAQEQSGRQRPKTSTQENAPPQLSIHAIRLDLASRDPIGHQTARSHAGAPPPALERAQKRNGSWAWQLCMKEWCLDRTGLPVLGRKLMCTKAKRKRKKMAARFLPYNILIRKRDRPRSVAPKACCISRSSSVCIFDFDTRNLILYP